MGPDQDQGQPIFILGNDAKVCCRIGVMHMWYRYLLHISTVVNVFSYAIVFFSAQILVDQEQRNKTKNGRCTGGGGEDSLSMRSILTSLVLAV